MPVPHYNFYPPAGQVIDATDGRVQWNGRAWMLKGKVYGVPSTHRLIGKPGSSFSGWYYDWQKRAWMEPSNAPAFPPGGGSVPSRPQPRPQPPVRRAPEKKEEVMSCEKSKGNVIDSLIKHPVAPVLGGVLLLASHLTEEPQPPTIPADLPEPIAKQWQMIYNQNQQRFQRRMEMYENLGMVLLGYAETRALLDALPAKGATTVVTSTPSAGLGAARSAM